MPLFFNILALGMTALLGWLYLYGIEHDLFWIYPWFDVLLHSIGGFVMGSWACAVSSRLSLPLRPALFLVGATALMGGVAWEGFEYLFALQGGLLDTVSDLVLGVAGALGALVLYALISRLRV